MARDERTPEQFESIAKELSDAATTLEAAAALMRENKMPSALIHGSTTLNRYLPAVLEWVDKIPAEVKSQLRAYLAGIKSQAEIHKSLNNTRKLAAAKKAPKKKAT